jgi:WD40 repeat protein
VEGLAFSSTGDALTSAGRDGSVKLWDVIRGKGLFAYRHNSAVTAIAFAPDGGAPVVGCLGNTVERRDISGTDEPFSFAAAATSLACTGDGRLLAVGGPDGTVVLYDRQRHLVTTQLRGHSGAVSSLAFAPGDRALASAGEDGTVRLWDVPAGVQRRLFRSHTDRVRCVAFSPDGALLASAGGDGTVRLWEPALNQDYESLLPSLVPSGPIAFAPDGRTLAVACAGATVALIDPETWKVRQTLCGQGAEVLAVVFAPDGKALVTTGDDRSVCVWDLAAGRPRTVLSEPVRGLASLSLSPDGETLALGGDTQVKLLGLATGKERVLHPKQPGEVGLVTFSADGTLVAAATGASLTVWDVGTGTRRWQQDQARPVVGIAFSHSRLRFASLDEAGWVRIWPLPGDAPPRQFWAALP